MFQMRCREGAHGISTTSPARMNQLAEHKNMNKSSDNITITLKLDGFKTPEDAANVKIEPTADGLRL